MRQPHFTRHEIREVDRRSIELYGIPGVVLMENAARGVAEHAMAMLPAGGRVLIVCGGGNNGGDGLAAARHLHNAGAAVTIVGLRPDAGYTGDARINLDICRAMRLPTLIAAADADVLPALAGAPEADLILDGLFGTGLSSTVRPPFDAAIAWMNRRTTPILSIDIPSGLDCDTGEPLGIAVRAAATVTFVGLKKGFLNPASRAYTGEVHIADIGAPVEPPGSWGETKER